MRPRVLKSDCANINVSHESTLPTITLHVTHSKLIQTKKELWAYDCFLTLKYDIMLHNVQKNLIQNPKSKLSSYWCVLCLTFSSFTLLYSLQTLQGENERIKIFSRYLKFQILSFGSELAVSAVFSFNRQSCIQLYLL